MPEILPVKLTSQLGFGTMSMTAWPSPPPISESVKTLIHVASHYTNFFNGGEFYGAANANLKLLRQFLEEYLKIAEGGHGKRLVLSVKGALDSKTFIPDGSKVSIDTSIANVVSHLNDVRDKYPKDCRPLLLYQMARVDVRVPYTESIGYIYEHVKNGDIDGISISETAAKTIEAAASVAPISVAEVEFSLMVQDIRHNGVLDTCKRLAIPIIAYSPLGRGLLTKQCVQDPKRFLDSIPETDPRKLRKLDRYMPDNFYHNAKCLEALQKYAQEHHEADLEHLALGYIVKMSALNSTNGEPSIIPIPSGSTIDKVERNFKTILPLTDEDIDNIHKLLDTHTIKGLRYNTELERMCFL
ncbi:aldo/keto reductase [Gregarina niphandrodes]|uniref:Aldo/keto reductase n=1 Tax=Gregarina niphandrodes TaxID=110365 RepID=A0A023B8Y7_GRENI|nr:aldo/keto reductase [Gregarina niphandrodes]EZG70564.1 aldo/keto reductase [Gregarina niphandrodes]|eukprot:XP_011129921.1 aldo/keto reductase [Gregarina niphandrodes]